ncbi:SGNH/GDSL hydrolase family protein [Streptomyces sp. Q6]|uniref:SGNH/GDSL hydrolase family protein n=1 Tax=Streptomyces citrinus TaxID=3118173 RepID=A0ACD5ANH4_9ACTN
MPHDRQGHSSRHTRRGRSLRTLFAALTAFAVAAAGAITAHATTPQEQTTGTRVSAWSPGMTTGGPSFENRTIRMVVHSSVAGSEARITLSNRYSPQPLRVAVADVAVQAGGGAAEPGTVHHLTFGGAAQTTIPAGAERFSDTVPLAVEAGQNLLVTLYLPESTGPSTWHSDAFDTTYIATGDHTGDTGAAAFTTTTTSWYYLAGLDVLSPTAKGTVVAFGDSITDGYHSTTGTYTRWPDFLATRLAAAPGPQRLSVVDAGIGGNRVLTDVPNPWQGVSALKRFRHDALGRPGVKDVILLEGINDIGNDAGPDGGALTTQHLVEGYRTLIDQAHAVHVRVIGATLMPFKGNGYYTPAAEEIRRSANTWIRTSGAFDGVIDFDRAMRDPADPAALHPDFDSGDHIHPDDAGMRAMADAVDLHLLHR